MKPEQQRIAIAEACGWTWWPCQYNKEQRILARSQEEANTLFLGQYIWQLAPNYLNDLNAMHEAEKILRCDKWKWLTYVNGLNEIPSLQDEWLCASIHATAAQRAEAFLRALNLWTD